MKQKMITIPFDVERAKQIQAGEVPGKIVTRDGKDARIVCWDRQDDTFPIVVLIYSEKQLKEFCECYKANGCYLTSESKYEKDLLIQAPEWTQYKDGDILACETHNGPNDYYKWFSILKGEVGLLVDNISFSSYVSFDHESSYHAGELTYDEHADNIDTIRLATEEEKQKFIKRLQKENTDEVKDILKRFFGIEKPEYKFEPFQKVLVRFGDESVWEASLFSHIGDDKYEPFNTVGGIRYEQCIPYNDQTKHLLGTTDNWEE